MEKIISGREFDELLNLKGEVRGMGVKTHADFVFKEEGKEGLEKLEKAMEDLGRPIKFKEIRSTSFIPLGVEAIVLLVIKRLFNYENKKFQEIGSFHVKSSLIIRLFMKYFVSFEKMQRETPKIWRKYFTIGELKITNFDKEKKCASFKLENFKFHPLHCQILIGTFVTIIQMMVNGKATCEEEKCIYRGDEHHEFLLKW